MKVIKERTIDNAVYRCVCINCSSLLEYTKDDLWKREITSDIKDVFQCPVCNEWNKHNEENRYFDKEE